MGTFLHHKQHGAKLFKENEVTTNTFDLGWRDSPDRFEQSSDDAWRQWVEEKPEELRKPDEDEESLYEAVIVEEDPVEPEPEPEEPDPIDSLSKQRLLKILRSKGLKGNAQERHEVLARRVKESR